MITKVRISNYRAFESLDFECQPDLNIIVGDNEAGKSTILEAINLCLTKKLNARFVDSELSPHLFNQACVATYLAAVRSGRTPTPPKIRIEVYLEARPEFADFRGLHNDLDEDACGVALEICLDDDLGDLYESAIKDVERLKTVPIECYRVTWLSFSGNPVPSRGISARTSYVDATTIRLQSGADYYLQDVISSGLKRPEQAAVAHAFRNLRENFSEDPAIKQINEILKKQKGVVSNQELTVGMDLSSRGSWQASLTPHLDAIPYTHVGKGEQSVLKIMLALHRVAGANVLLIEEPENHLSFSTMSILIERMREQCEGSQLFITTHSPFVLNKLGLGGLALLSGKRFAYLRQLTGETQEYFKRLPGYDTLRLVLAKHVILVEGPSDELLVQRAYRDRHGKLPIDDGIDVLSVRGLSFLRFLEIAKPLGIRTRVVTDNDGNFEHKVRAKYAGVSGAGIEVFADSNDDLPTLEDHIVACNDLALLNGVCRTSHPDSDAIKHWMKENKSDWALKAFESTSQLTMPDYVARAVA